MKKEINIAKVLLAILVPFLFGVCLALLIVSGIGLAILLFSSSSPSYVSVIIPISIGVAFSGLHFSISELKALENTQ